MLKVEDIFLQGTQRNVLSTQRHSRAVLHISNWTCFIMYDEISCLTLLNVCTYHMQSLVYTLFLSFCLQRWTGPAPPAVAHSQLDCVESGWQVSGQKGVLSVWVSHEPQDKLGSFLTNAIFKTCAFSSFSWSETLHKAKVKPANQGLKCRLIIFFRI